MGKAAHDLRDRAAVHTEVEGRPRLAPSGNFDGMEDVAGGEMIARKLVGHSRSLTPTGELKGSDLNEATKDAILVLGALHLWPSLASG